MVMAVNNCRSRDCAQHVRDQAQRESKKRDSLEILRIPQTNSVDLNELSRRKAKKIHLDSLQSYSFRFVSLDAKTRLHRLTSHTVSSL